MEWLRLLLTLVLLTCGYSNDELTENLALRCCVVQEKPIAFINEKKYSTGGIDGLVAEYLSQMQAIVGWKCSSVSVYSQGDMTSFNSFVNMMDECSEDGKIKNNPECMCDIGASGWFPTSDRYQRVDFILPFVFEGYRVIFPRSISNSKENGLFFLTAFDIPSWMCIIVLVALLSTAKLLSTRSRPHLSIEFVRRNHPHVFHLMRSIERFPFCNRLPGTIVNVVNALVTHSRAEADGTRYSLHRSILDMITTFIGLILILSYESSMTASLVQEKLVSQFQSAEDFRNCRILPEDVCIPGGGAMELFWNRSIAQDTLCHQKSHPWIGSYEDLYKGLENGSCKYAMLLESTAKNYMEEKHCGKYILSEQSIFRDGLSMILPKGSNYTQTMNIATLQLRGDALLPAMERYFRSQQPCNISDETSLPFRKLRGFFIISIAAPSIYITAILFTKYVRNQRSWSIQSNTSRPGHDAELSLDVAVRHESPQQLQQ